MNITTGIHMLDLVLSILLDRTFQVVFFFFYCIYWCLRLPKPRRGAGNKAIFITGCDSGMGHRIARRLDEMEAVVFAGCLNPNGPGAKSLKESCSDRLHIVPIDITSDKQVEEAVAYVKGNIPIGENGLYALINNAGVFPYMNFELMPLDHCRQVIDINLVGTLRVTKAFLPLIQNAKGRIVTITSVSARLSFPDTAVYTATKFALNGLFSALRLDLADTGVHIATVEPGDYSTTTNILQWSQQHLEEIWKDLAPAEQEAKRHLYERAKLKIYKTKLPEDKQEENYKYLIENIEHATFAEEPFGCYVCGPMSQRLSLAILRMLPERISQRFIKKALKS